MTLQGSFRLNGTGHKICPELHHEFWLVRCPRASYFNGSWNIYWIIQIQDDIFSYFRLRCIRNTFCFHTDLIIRTGIVCTRGISFCPCTDFVGSRANGIYCDRKALSPWWAGKVAVKFADAAKAVIVRPRASAHPKVAVIIFLFIPEPPIWNYKVYNLSFVKLFNGITPILVATSQYP